MEEQLKKDLVELQNRLSAYEDAYLKGDKDPHVKASIKFYRTETQRVRNALLGTAPAADGEEVVL